MDDTWIGGDAPSGGSALVGPHQAHRSRVVTARHHGARLDLVPRWEQGSADRLTRAALELFEERGFEDTSVVEIADRARVTTRTFFRYFPDKAEVLFAQSDQVRAALVQGLHGAPDVTRPLRTVTAVLAGFDWAGPGMELRRQRHAVIAANPGLLERDLVKQNEIADEFADVLRRRGVEADAARLAARVGIQVFSTAYDQWVGGDDGADLTTLTDAAMALLETLVPAD